MSPNHQFAPHEIPKERFDLILSPHYYWVKQSDRHFKNKAIAKKFAASVFEFDSLYEYDVYEQDDTMVFVAFDPADIKERLIKQGIDLNLVSNIYLSQSFFKADNEAIMMSEDEALVEINNLLVVVPLALCEHVDSQKGLEGFTSIHAQALKIGSLGNKSLEGIIKPFIALGIVFFLWIVTSFINLYQTQNELESLKDALKQTYELPQTSFQMKSLLKRLEKTDAQQQFFRETVHALTLYKQEFSASLNRIKMNHKEIRMEFSKPISAALQKKLKRSLKQYAKQITFRVEHSGMIMKVLR